VTPFTNSVSRSVAISSISLRQALSANRRRAGVAWKLREEMKRASQEIAKDPARMRAAEREGLAPQVRNFVRQAEREQGREKGRGVERDEGLER
jgi:hypothetical protein